MFRSSEFTPLPVLWILSAGSGCAALIYEIVWFQLLQLVIGSSTLSLAALLGAFMGGMCVGSLALPRVISVRRHPLRIYAYLELAIGVMGILAPVVVPGLGAAPAMAYLIPPALMMGATLPAICRATKVSPGGLSSLGLLYAGNITGAVLGCILAGFYLLRVYDMNVAALVAVMINIAVAVVALSFSNRSLYKPSARGTSPIVETGITSGDTLVCAGIALSGLAALGAEAIWTRALSLVLGPTVYAFSMILAVFLIGLGLGSSAGSAAARNPKLSRLGFGLCQLLLTGAITWASWEIAYSLPYWKLNPAAGWWHTIAVDFVRCIWAILPAACLWGASFPLALAGIRSPDHDPGRLISRIYAANTVGAIAGAGAFSVFILPWGGSQQAQRWLVGISALSGLMVLGRELFAVSRHLQRRLAANFVWLAMAAAAAIVLAWVIPPLPGLLIAYGRELSLWAKTPPAVRYAGEGLNASVAVTEWPSGVRNFHVSGKIEASTAARDMRLQRMLGHLPALMHPNPRSVLVVGFGAGVTAGSFVLYPSIERIVVCEIEPLIPAVVSRYFQKENYDVLHDPRVQVVYDDARHYILTTREKFDIITSDPIHPWVKGAATLYSTEYFETVKQHLNPGGVASQWVPLYDSTEDVVKSEIATFFATFPNGAVWSSDIRRDGYDTVLTGQDGGTRIDLDRFAERLGRNDHRSVVASLEEVNFAPPLSIFSTYAGSAAGLQPWLRGAEITTDRNLRLQYLAGLVTNFSAPGTIYRSLMRYRKFPEDMFIGAPVLRESLRETVLGQ